MGKNKSTIVLLVLLVIGLLLGNILGEILSKLGVPYIFDSSEISWSPSGNLMVIAWDIDIVARINLASVIGLFLTFYIYRKL